MKILSGGIRCKRGNVVSSLYIGVQCALAAHIHFHLHWYSWNRALGIKTRDEVLIKMDSLIHQCNLGSRGVNMYSLKYLVQR